MNSTSLRSSRLGRGLLAFSVAAAGALGACGDPGGNGTSPLNAAPQIGGTPPLLVMSGEMYDFTPEAEDPDHDTLEFSASNLPAWLSFDPNTGTLSGSPGFDELGIYRGISIAVSDGESTTSMSSFAVEVASPRFAEDNFTPSGVVTETTDGYAVDGSLALHFTQTEQTIEDAELQLTFDENGDLLDIVGDGTLPEVVDDHVRLDSGVSMTAGLMTGAEINDDDRFDVILLKGRQYLLYYLDYGITLEITNPMFPGQQLTVSAPPIPGIPNFLMITDPYDPMYYYGDGDGFAYAYSFQGLLPFVPNVDHPLILPFEGHHYAKGTVAFGFKVFDFFSFTGDRVIFDPTFDPMTEPGYFPDGPSKDRLGAKIGFNGAFQFDFSIGPVGLFSFDIGEATAVMEANLSNQYMVLTGYIDPDVSWAPDWMPFVPQSRITAELTWEFLDVDSVDAFFTGAYTSELPEADVEGTVHLTLDEATMEAIVRDQIDIPVSITFADGKTRAEVGLEVDFTTTVDDAVDGAFDRAAQEVDHAITDLGDAVEEYEIEVSLRGLRGSLPTIADTAIDRLDAIPPKVESAVRDEVVSQINANRTCVPVFGCSPSNESRDSIANSAASSAKAQATQKIVAHVQAMEDLKSRAQQADDESLRAALETALRAAYAHRAFNETISVTVEIVGTTKTVSKTVNQTVIPEDAANRILEAANNAYRIQETSDRVIHARGIVDSLPTRQAVENARQSVEQGVAEVPSLDAVGYEVVDGEYTGFVRFRNGSMYTVDFNVLDFDEAVTGISDLMVEVLVE